MTAFTVAAVQAAYVLMDRDATIDRVAALTAEAAAKGAKLVVFPGGLRPRRPDLEGRRHHLGGRRRVVRDARRPGDRRAEPGDRASRVDRARARRHARRRRRRARPEPGHDLQHDPLLRSRREPHGQAPQARPDRLRADGLGHGRRQHAAGDRHRGRTRRRADLLGELHAAGAVLHVLAGDRRLGGPDARARRWLGLDDAPHRARGPDVRHRREPVPAGRPDPGELPGPRQGLEGRCR